MDQHHRYKLLVGPFVYQQGELIPSIVILRDARFDEVFLLPSLAISEEAFVRAVNGDHQVIEAHAPLFTALAAELQRSWSLTSIALTGFENLSGLISQVNHALAALPQEQTAIFPLPGLLLLPGLIDIHTHFRTPGQEWKEDFTTGSRAALKGGITTIFDMPNNLQPTITQERIDEKKALARQFMQVNYGFYYGITDENVDAAREIMGHCGYKVFLGSSTGNLLITNWQRTLPRCYALDRPVMIHAEDEEMIRRNMQNVGVITPLDHPRIRNPQVAEAAVRKIEQTMTALATPPRASVIVAHISTPQELAIIQRLQRRHLPVLSEVTLHHLLLTLKEFEAQPRLLKTNPPLRSAEDAHAMQQALQQDRLTFVSSDHAPHSLAEKQGPQPPSGVPGMEYNLLLLFDRVAQGKLGLHTLINACTVNPCRYFNLSETGVIAKGFFADCVLLDPLKQTTIANDGVQSKAGYSPFHGWTVRGRVEATIVNGDIGFWQGDFWPVRPRDLF